jgi:hypothetical protein
MRIAGRNKWEILLKYYPPWEGYPSKKVKDRNIREIREVFEMVGDPRKLEAVPEDVKAIMKFVRPDCLLGDA